MNLSPTNLLIYNNLEAGLQLMEHLVFSRQHFKKMKGKTNQALVFQIMPLVINRSNKILLCLLMLQEKEENWKEMMPLELIIARNRLLFLVLLTIKRIHSQ